MEPRIEDPRDAARGDETVVTSGGWPTARLVRPDADSRREVGFDAGIPVVPDDFDDPLADALLDDFER